MTEYVRRVALVCAVVVLLVLLSGPSMPPVAAQDGGCDAVIVRVPWGYGLPVMAGPSWFDLFTGVNVPQWQHVRVYSAHHNLDTGEIWFATPQGYVQVYTGYTTGVVQVLVSDALCDIPAHVVE